MLKFISNAVAFNLCWFGLVLQGNLAVPFALAWIVVHVALQKDARQELRFIAVAGLIGVLTDTLLMKSGVLVFGDSVSWLPLWMIALWISFTTTLNHSLAILLRSRALRLLAAVAGAPSSYLLGSRLGNVELGLSHLATYAVLAVTWIILLEIFAWLAHQRPEANSYHTDIKPKV